MNAAYRIFFHALRWNSVESIVYQLALMVHQIYVFKVTSYEFFGLAGTFFSLTYLMVMFINSGFDASCASFFSKYSMSKSTIRSFLFKSFFVSILVALVLLITFILGKKFLISQWSAFEKLSIGFIIIICLLIFLEVIKKVGKVILQLAGKSHVTACAEIITMFLYSFIVWISYFYWNTLTLHMVFAPMVFLLIIKVIVFGWYGFSWYTSIPEGDTSIKQIDIYRILKNRFFIFLHQMSNQLFSSNFLVPLFALQFGLEYAALLRLMSTIVYSITSIIQKIFTTSSIVAFAHSKENFAQTKDLFKLISEWINQIVIMLSIFFLINYSPIFGTTKSHIILGMGYLYLLISFCATLFIAYEEFYIIQEKTFLLCCINGILLLFTYFGIAHNIQLSPILTLAILALLRIASFITLSIISYSIWKIRPSIKFHSISFIGSLVISLLFFIISQTILVH